MGLLRLLLAVAVIIAHSFPIFKIKSVGGEVAVEAFFMISGFYMALVLNGKYGSGSYRLFITNRLLRLYPIYWFILAVTVVSSTVSYLCGGSPLKLYSYVAAPIPITSGDWALLFFTNVFIIGQDVVMFLGLDKLGHLFFTSDFRKTSPPLYTFLFVHQAWSLAIEIAFYLVAPFLVRRRPAVLLLLCIGSLLLRVWFYHLGLYRDPWSYRLFPCELVFFLVGALAFRAYEVLRSKQLSPLLLWAAFGLVVSYTIFYQFIPDTLARQVSYYLCFATALPFIFILTKNSKWMNKIGELSYPVYICHVFILLTTPYFLEWLHLPQRLLAYWAVATSILFSILIVRFIAEPIERIRQRRVAKAKEQKILA